MSYEDEVIPKVYLNRKFIKIYVKEVDDELWRRIRHYMPRQKPKTGRPRADLRKTMG